MVDVRWADVAASTCFAERITQKISKSKRLYTYK